MEIIYDIFMPIGPSDYEIAEKSILNKRQYLRQLGDIYYCAQMDLNLPAIYIPENSYPFNFQDIKENIKCIPGREGWYYQQLKQLYFGSLNLSSLDYYLTICADVFFNEEISFFNGSLPIYTYGHEVPNQPYFSHMKRLNSDLKCFDNKSVISHHSIFNKKILIELFSDVESRLGEAFWVAFLQAVLEKESSAGAAEYELYFNFLRLKNYPIETRSLEYLDTGSFWYGKNSGAPFFAYHWYLRRGLKNRTQNLKRNALLLLKKFFNLNRNIVREV